MHRIAAIKPDARVATVEGSGHMIPMERPDRVRAAIESAALMAQAGRKFHGME
jgi:pimeloyl-ACP methyl ester carboxylesterase